VEQYHLFENEYSLKYHTPQQWSLDVMKSRYLKYKQRTSKDEGNRIERTLSNKNVEENGNEY
jgi:hypothetical protein